MNREEFFRLFGKLKLRFPEAMEKIGTDSLNAWFEDLESLPFEQIERAAKRLWTETEFLKFGPNIGAILRNLASPQLNAATIQNHLDMALALARSPRGNQYVYLEKISPRLLELAENADLFSRDISSESSGFRVRQVAAMFLEERENEKRGYGKPVPNQGQITGPVNLEISEEQRLKNLERLRCMRLGK